MKNKNMPRKSKKQIQTTEEFYQLSNEAKKGILVIFLFLVAIIIILSYWQMAGQGGTYLDYGLSIAFGWGKYLLPLLLLFVAFTKIRAKYHLIWLNYLGLFLFLINFQGILHQKLPQTSSFELSYDGLGGGLLGYLISFPLNNYLGFLASTLIMICLLLSGLILIFNSSIGKILQKLNLLRMLPGPKFKEYYDTETEEEERASFKQKLIAEAKSQAILATATKMAGKEISGNKIETEKPFYSPIDNEEKIKEPTIRAPKFHIDLPIELLDDKKSKPTSGDINVGMERIHRTLENFHINVEMGEVQVGPTVTQYTLKPADGIKLSRITALNNDLALALAAHPLRIEAPIPGKSLVGIEVPNQKPAVVRIREILDNESFKNRKTNTTIVLGKDVSGKCWVADLASMPHLLVAGSTGSGKSVCLNAIIMSLIYQNNPDTLRLILVDPKRVEFPVYNGIPHLLTPVITDVTKTVYALRWAIGEMDSRFDTLAKLKKRNIASYNEVSTEKMPYLVIIIDELADLMVAAAAEVEGSIIRLTQMARAVGIHLVVATQRPSVDVITGLIKANIPCRIAFSVASLMDSRTILDSSGAEKLVGKGDMLYMSQDTSRPRRLQGAYVSDDEIKRVVDYLKDACTEEIQYLDNVTSKPTSATSFEFEGGNDNGDELFDEAKKLILESGKASASYLQRRLRIGYSRAARLIDLMEDAGIVGPADGAKPRDILVDKSVAFSSSPSKNSFVEKPDSVELVEEKPNFQQTTDLPKDEPKESSGYSSAKTIPAKKSADDAETY
ncbi:MAG: DNA translocase FtsK 4TM domain-containing protein [Patescibacteria group bacterium]